MKAFHAFATFVLVSMLVAPVIAHQQDAQATEIVITPESLTLEVGDTTEVSAVVKDADGNVVEGATVVFLSTARRALGVTPTGQVEAYRPGGTSASDDPRRRGGPTDHRDRVRGHPVPLLRRNKLST